MNDGIFDIIEIEINHGCNMSCHYCPVSIGQRLEKGKMSSDIYKKILTDLSEMNFKGKLSPTFYNEPLLSDQLEFYVEETKRILPETSIEIYTNGTLLTTDRFRSLVRLGVGKFIVTKHEGCDSSYVFEKTLKELTNEDREHLIYRSYREINLTNRGGLMKNVGSNASTVFMPCYLPEKRITITVKGNVVVCSEDFFQKNQMGNVMESSLLSIWKSDAYKLLRDNLRKGLRHKYEVCNDCNRWEVL